MSRDYSDGNRDGHEDGRTGDNRLAHRGALLLLNLGTWLPGGGLRINQYVKGYVQGFQDEVRVLHVSPVAREGSVDAKTVSPKGSDAMSRATSFSHQVELLQNLKGYLSEFQERLHGVAGNYRRKVDNLHGEGGLMDETHRDFVEQQLEPTCALIQRLIDHIEASDIPAVEREISYLEQKL